MRTETIEKTYFQFDELSEEAKQKALECMYDINVDHSWWDFVYEDAKNIHIDMQYWDEYFNIENFSWRGSSEETCLQIIKDHGEDCNTRKIAQEYLPKIQHELAMIEIFENLRDGGLHDDIYELLDEVYDKHDAILDDLSDDLLDELKGAYGTMLRENYEYHTSEEAIIETILANEYEFDEDGNF
jgi:hypothetical protein